MGHISELLPKEIREDYLKVFDDRPYQFEALQSILKCLQKKSNVVLTMPSGLGKTFLAQILFVLWGAAFKNLEWKILLVLPGRLSLHLYRENIAWVNKFVSVAVNEPGEFKNTDQYLEAIQDAKVLITNPRRMINLVYRNIIPYAQLQEYGLVILDGYEDILQPDDNRNQGFNNQANILFALLASSNCHFLMLGDVYIENTYWHSRVNPVKVEINHDLAQEFIPYVRINLRGVYDPHIHEMDRLLRKHMAESMGTIKQSVLKNSDQNHPIRMYQLVSQMRRIASGERDKFYLFFRKKAPLILTVNKELQMAFQRIVRVIDLRLLLFEDLVTDLDPDREWGSDAQFTETHFYLNDRNARINLNGKVRIVKKVVMELGEKRGLIFCRNLEICEYLAGVFIGSGRYANIIHNQITATERQLKIKEFKRRKGSVLLMTRYAVSQGFDIPEADYAIFYSPKDEEEVMWREISRIRSTWKDQKEIFILYYKGTGEESKLNRLLWHMKGRDRYILSAKDMPSKQVQTEQG